MNHTREHERVGKRIETTVQRIISGGIGLARLGGKVLLVKGALPGERVTAEIIREKRDYCEASVLEVKDPSSSRIVPPCPWYGTCGGCDFQFASPEYQIELKRQMLIDALRRGTGIQLDPADLPMASGSPWGYRRRVRLARDPETGCLGFRKKQSHKVVPVDSCMVLHESLQAYVGSQGTEEQVALFAGDAHVSVGSRAAAVTLENSAGQRHTFALDARVFFQSNLTLMPAVIDFVQQHPCGGRAIDLYSGVGTFAAFLADCYEEVTAVERDDRCLAYAAQNLPGHIQFFTESVESWMKQGHVGRIGRLVADPPRSGLHADAVRQIMRWKPETIVYISCSPVTCFRDLKRFISGGYRLDHLMGADFYPQTAHIECAAFLRRATRSMTVSHS